MPICKFFLQGTCRFGDSCKFDHQIGSERNNYGGSNSILLQNYSSNPAQTASTTPTNVDTAALIKSVVTDMTSSEKGGQWLLSCYAPFKEKPAFPGFEDYSMEEIRHLYYEASKSGHVEQYKQNLQLLLGEAMSKIKALQNPSLDIINMLKMIYNTPASSTAGVFQLQSQNSTQNQTNTSFGAKPQQQTGIFGGQTQAKPQNQSNGIFGGPLAFSLPKQPIQSIFGQTPQQPVLGVQNSAPFAQPQAGQFGVTQTQQSSSPFNTLVQPNVQQQTPFRSPLIQSNQPQTTPFAPVQSNQPQTTPFGNPPVQSNQPQTTPFGNPPVQSNQPQTTPFGNPSVQSNQPQTTPFGNPPVQSNQPQTTPFGNPSVQSNQPQIPFGNVSAQQNQPFSNSLTQQSSVFQRLGTGLPPTSHQNGAPMENSRPSSIFGRLGTTTAQNVAPLGGNSAQTSVFGGLGQGNQGLGTKNPPNEDFYSKREDLSQEDIKWFESDDLDINHIPELPPTYEMCFKS